MSEPRILGQELAFKGKHIQVRLDRILDSAGNTSTLEIVVHPGAVVLCRSWITAKCPRPPISPRRGSACSRFAQEVSAGEDPLEAARRELEEETGYLAGKLVERARFWTTPGFTMVHVSLQAELTKTQTNPDRARSSSRNRDSDRVPSDDR